MIAEMTDHPLILRGLPICNTGCNAYVGLARVSAQQALESREKRHEWTNFFFRAQGLQGIRQAPIQSQAFVRSVIRLTLRSDILQSRILRSNILRSNMVRRHIVEAVSAGQLLLPEGNVFRFLLLEPLLLPSHEVSVLTRNLGEGRWLSGRRSPINESEFLKQNCHGPIIGDDVMGGQQQQVVFRPETPQLGPQ